MSSPATRPSRRAKPAAPARPRRGGRRAGLTVAVVGAADPLGTLVVERLLARSGDGGIGKVLALDAVRGPAAEASWRVGPLDTPDVANRLRGADVVVHLAAAADLAATLRVPTHQRRDEVVRRAQAVSMGTAAVGARRLVAVTSAMVLGATRRNVVPMPDDAPIRALPDAGVVGDLLEVEQVLARVPRSHPGVSLTVLRPAALVGPGVDTVVTRHFEAPRLLVVRDAQNQWQFCHLADLAEAVAVAVVHDLDGTLTVGSEGTMAQADVERISGMRRVELPEALALVTAQRLHRVGVLPAPASDLAYVIHPWAVTSARLRAAGWSPRYDNQTCLGVLLEQVSGHHAVAARRLDRKDAAFGAAGAAVALVGTAAIVRRRRRRES